MADSMSDTPQTCSSDCGDDRSGYLALDWKIIVYSAVAIFFASQLAIVVFGRVVGGALGWYLRRASSGRRAHLIGLKQHDQKIARDKRLQMVMSKGEAGEKPVSQAPDGAAETKPDADWAGVVGFFHPFWYVLSDIELIVTWGLY